MNGREIPGFCWDPEKEKYFRIQANHVAPAGSQYSAQAVKKRKRVSEVKKHQESVARRIEQQRVRKSPHFSNPISRIATEIESDPVRGFAKQSRQGQAFASQLELHHGVDFKNIVPEGTIADFVHGEEGAIIVGINTASGCELIVCPSVTQEKRGEISDAPADTLHIGFESRFSSLSLNYSGAFLATMDSNTEGKSTLLVGITDLFDENPVRSNLTDMITHDATMWCSAANPGSDINDPLFAIGTSDGLYILRERGCLDLTRANITLPRTTRRPRRGATHDMDLLALGWVSPTVVATGFRNSLVGLYDVRSRGFATRIQHPRSVGQVKSADENRLVVAGYRSMQMYDLRFPSKRGILSNSCLTFEGYDSEFRHQIDLNCELGLVASITDGEGIRFHSLADGSSIPTSRSVDRDMTATNRVMFENSQEGKYPRLMVSRGTVVAELAW